MAYDGVYVRGTASFTGAAAKFGSGGRAGGVYDVGALLLEATGAVSGGALGTFTVEGWFKGTNPGAIRLFWGTASAHYFGHDSSGNLLLAYGAADTWLTTSAAVCDNAWHHVAAVFDANAGTVSAYCDGARVGTVSATPTGANPNAFGIGGFVSTAGFDSLGALDEIRFSKTARYSGATYSTPSAAFTSDSDTIALYHMEADVTNNVGGGGSPPATGTILPNDTNIVYSPYTWHANSTRAQTICAGAYLIAEIAGGASAISLTFDDSLLGTPTSQVFHRIDKGPWVLADVAAEIALTIPATNDWDSHVVEVIVKATSEALARWAGTATAVRFTGFTTTPDTCTTVALDRPSLRILCFGDSITEGVRALNNSATDDTDKNDATRTYAHVLGELLGAEVGQVGFGGLGFIATGSGSVPPLPDSWDLLFTGQARDVATDPPDVVVINLATNDASNVTTTATGVLNDMLTAMPTTKIAVMRTFNGSRTSELLAAIAACDAPARVTYINTTGWWNSSDASDSLHPYGYTHVGQLGPLLAEALRTHGLVVGGSGSGGTVKYWSGSAWVAAVA